MSQWCQHTGNTPADTLKYNAEKQIGEIVTNLTFAFAGARCEETARALGARLATAARCPSRRACALSSGTADTIHTITLGYRILGAVRELQTLTSS